jgi:hypothetical protein
MIVIPIKTCTDESENDERNTEDIESPMEWSLIELNGELLPPKQIPLYDPTNDHPATPPPNVELGSLYFDSKVGILFSLTHGMISLVATFIKMYTLCIEFSHKREHQQ